MTLQDFAKRSTENHAPHQMTYAASKAVVESFVKVWTNELSVLLESMHFDVCMTDLERVLCSGKEVRTLCFVFSSAISKMLNCFALAWDLHQCCRPWTGRYGFVHFSGMTVVK